MTSNLEEIKEKGWHGALLRENAAVLCFKTVVKESRKFELARLKKKKKEKHLASFWFGTFLRHWVCCLY